MKLLTRYMSILIKSEMQYKASFVLLSIAQFFVPFLTFIAILLLFQRFSSIAGWTLYEVALCYAVIHVGFSLSGSLARGFDTFANLIIRGDFDRILVRPRGTIVQVMGSRLDFYRIGRLMQSILVLAYALFELNITWDMYKIITLVLMMISGTVIFTGIYMLGATMCFWSVEGLEIVNLFTDGGREISQYPLSIYHKWIRNFFTFVIPFATVNYLPLMYVLGKTPAANPTYMLIPVAGMLFILPCILIWNFGVAHYKSTGS